MTLRVVLYAEGSGESGGALELAAGEAIPDRHLGPGHVLVARALCVTRPDVSGIVRFEAPLRGPRGRVAKGSDLLVGSTLRRLVTWARPDARPDVAAAAPEFEAWLVADVSAVASVIGGAVDQLPQRLEPRQAKEQLSRWIADAELGDERLAVRRASPSAAIWRRWRRGVGHSSDS